MKHLKKFESYNAPIVKYWKFLSKKHLKFALKKIGLSTEEIESYYNVFSHYPKEPFYIVQEHNDTYNKLTYSWSNEDPKNYETTDKNLKDYVILEFMGEIDIDDSEVDGEKYNL